MSANETGRTVGIVVVTYNPGHRLHAFLDSVADASEQSVRVVVADNGSTDGAPQHAARERANVSLLVDPSNPGYGTAANAGAAVLGPDVDWYLICNPDLEFSPGAIDTLVDSACKWDDVGSAGPQILNADGQRYPSARELPSLRIGIGHAVFVGAWPKNPWTRRYTQHDELSDSAVPKAVGWLSGACLLVRRDAWEKLGGFDEDFFMYFEDVDLGARLGKAGYLNVYVPQSVVVHEGATSTSQHPERMLRAHHKSAMQYLAKKHPHWILAPVRLALRLGLAVRLTLILRSQRRRARRTGRSQ